MGGHSAFLLYLRLILLWLSVINVPRYHRDTKECLRIKADRLIQSTHIHTHIIMLLLRMCSVLL